MTVHLDNEEIYNGPMSGFASDNGILLDAFQPDEVQVMDVSIYLPGPETGNEYMNLSHSHQWIFTAEGEDIVIIDEEDQPIGPAKPPKDKLPQTGGTPATLFFLAGAAIVTAGIVLKKKEQ